MSDLERRKTMSINNQVKQWKTEIEQGRVSFESFHQANQTFAGDYAIVNHSDTPKRRIFDEPNSTGMYSLSTTEGLTSQEFDAKVSGKNVVVLVMCMDKRAQRQTYAEVKSRHPNATILTLSMGGGIVQQDTIQREGKDVQVHRFQALQTELSFIFQRAKSVEAVYATGHDCQCGACKFFNDGKAVHEALNVGKGSKPETDEMANRINAGVNSLVPQQWIKSGIVKRAVVHIDPKTDQYSEMISL